MDSTTFSTVGSNTWTCPAYVYSVKVECWGAGGKGGRYDHVLDTWSGGGGGGGGYARLNAFASTPGTGYAYVVGGGSDSNNTTFNTSSCIANRGGNAGSPNNYNPGTGSSGTGDVVHTGGTGGNANLSSIAGGGGGGAGADGDGTNGGVPTVGQSGPPHPPYGTGGEGGGVGLLGSHGFAPGGGGGGHSTDFNSPPLAVGGDGQIILSYSYQYPQSICSTT